MATSHPWDPSRSPFVELMGTNYAPSVDQSNDIKTLLVKPYAELERLEMEITRALCEKEKISNFIEAHRALLSPVRQIPEEVLAEIFLRCLPTDTNATRSLDEAPLLLTTVSRDWRRVALNTPRLWRTLHIYLPPHLNNRAISRRAVGISTWLGRSGTLPLSISFHTRFQPMRTPLRTGTAHPDFFNNARLLISTITSFGHRIGDLCLSLPPPFLKMFDEISGRPFLVLEHFRVRDANAYNGGYIAWNPEGDHDDLCFAPLLTRAVALRSLEVSDIYVRGGGYLDLPINWEILTDLNLQSGNLSVGLIPSEALKTLQRTPNLESLRICFMLSQNPLDIASIGKIVLPHLTTMRISFSSNPASHLGVQESDIFGPQISSIVGSLSTASLKLLSLNVWNGDRIVNLNSIHDHGSGIQFCNLESLELDLEMTPEELTEYLASAPELVSFQVKDMGNPRCFSDSHLSALTPSHEHPIPLCPKLTSIRIFYGQLGENETNVLSSSSILSFVRGRATTLKVFDLYFSQEQSLADDDVAALRKLKEDGLNMRLHYADYRAISRQDSPLCGLPSESHLRLPPIVHSNRNQISDMEGPYGTRYICWNFKE
ncbi:hypothetical protein F5880DRAFT_823668 [Lentinula raphanica]|nr:hypothetical protein F5880DRAFT_823668 [Lentinula raphanica]